MLKTGEPGTGFRRIQFQHLRKTGGTTVTVLLENFLTGAPTKKIIAPPRTIVEAEQEAMRQQFLSGHENFLHLRSSDTFAFVFLRQPLSRLLSERRQWMQAQPQDIGGANTDVAAAITGLRAFRLAEMLDHVFAFPVAVSSFWNHQALTLGAWPRMRSADGDAASLNHSAFHRHFSDSFALCAWLERNRYSIVKDALTTLRSLDYVGIYEDFDHSVREVFARLRLPEPEIIPRLNERAHYPDEADKDLAARAKPFIDLDQELYEEALNIHARQGRAVRGTPIDYLGRSVGADEDKTFAANEPPGGHGWHRPALRADGKWCRWTGPGHHSDFTLHLDRAAYRIELTMFGGVSEAAIRTLSLSADGAPIKTTVAALPDGRWRAAAEFACPKAGHHAIRLTVSTVEKDHGIEAESFRFIGGGD